MGNQIYVYFTVLLKSCSVRAEVANYLLILYKFFKQSMSKEPVVVVVVKVQNWTMLFLL
jgi:hypothetical protein